MHFTHNEKMCALFLFFVLWSLVLPFLLIIIYPKIPDDKSHFSRKRIVGFRLFDSEFSNCFISLIRIPCKHVSCLYINIHCQCLYAPDSNQIIGSYQKIQFTQRWWLVVTFFVSCRVSILNLCVLVIVSSGFHGHMNWIHTIFLTSIHFSGCWFSCYCCNNYNYLFGCYNS